MLLTGRYLIEPMGPLSLETRFKRVASPVDHEPGARVIVVRGLNPAYYLLFNHIDLIVSRYGSALSHLALLAREAGLPIFLTDTDLTAVPRSGTMRVEGDEIEITQAGA